MKQKLGNWESQPKSREPDFRVVVGKMGKCYKNPHMLRLLKSVSWVGWPYHESYYLERMETRL